MHHTIKLGYGDTITIIAPEKPLTAAELARSRVTIEEINNYPIINRVCKAFELTVDDLLGRTRKQIVVIARLIVTYDIIHNHGKSMSDVGRLLCRNHTSIIHYLKTIKNLMDTRDDKFENATKQLKYYEESKIEIEVSRNASDGTPADR